MEGTGKPKKMRSKAQKIKDKQIIADLYLKGNSVRKIAELTGIGKTTVAKDLNELYDEWREASMADIASIKGRELARLEKIHSELWEVYEKSKQDGVKTITKVLGRNGKAVDAKDGEQPKNGGQSKNLSVEKTEVVEKNIGDPKILDSIAKVIEQKTRLLGLEKIKIEHSGSVRMEELKKMDDGQLDELIRRLSEGNG